MADDDDEVANVDESLQIPTPQSHRIDEGLGTEVVEDELPSREQEAAVSEGEAAEIVEAVVDGAESEGFEFGGSEGVGGGGVGIEGVVDDEGEETEVVEVNIGEGGDDESEDVKGKVGVKLETCAASEGYRLKAAFGDVEKIHESSKVEGGEDNVAGKSDVGGMVVEECHTKDFVEEKGEEFVKNLAAEQCAVMTACDDMEQIDHFGEKVKEEDGGENAAAGYDFIGKSVEDCHKNAAVEEKVKEEKNLAAEQSVAVTAIGDTAQIDESRDTLKKEEVIDDNMAGNTDLIGMDTEDSHMDDAIVEEKGEEFEKNVALEQCAVVTATGGMDQIVDSRNKSKEDGVREDNVAGDSEKNIVEVTRDHIDESGNVENAARDGDEEMGTEEENTNNQEKIEEGLSAAPDVEFSLHKVLLELTTGDGDEEMRSVEEKINNKEKLEEDPSAAPDVELSLHKVVLEPTTGDGDEEMGSEEENSGNKEMLEENLSAAPDLEFSLQEVVLEQTTIVGDEEMGSEVGNKENNEKLEEDLLTAPDVEFSLHNILLETAAGDGDEMGLLVENKENKGNLEEDLLTAPDVEFSLHNVVPETGDGDEEMGSEEDNSVNKEKLDKDLSAASDVDLSLHNVELEPTAGEEGEEFVDGEEPSRADAIESHIETPASEKGNIKPKRGRKPSKVALTKKTEEDVCFICFDGGDLVVCDRR